MFHLFCAKVPHWLLWGSQAPVRPFTLAKTILGLCSAEISGSVFFNDTNILNCDRKRLRKIRANLQVVFQDPISSLNPRMRVGEIIEEGIKIHQPSLVKKDIDKKDKKHS